MYAVIQSGGKQYKVQAGDIVQIEKIKGDIGTSAKFGEVLMVAEPGAEDSKLWIGKPLLAGAAVEGQIVGQGRGEKIVIVKMKRRKQYRRTQGHRQELTQVLVTSVANGAGGSKALSDTEKKAALGKFQSHLKPKGLAFSPKLGGSPKKRAAAAAAAHAAGKSGKAPAKKAAK